MANRHLKGYVYDMNRNLHTMEIYRLGYEGVDEDYLIEKSAVETPTISHRGSEKDTWDDGVIQGIEMTYQFYIPNADQEILDLIMDSDYGTYYLVHSIWIVGTPVPHENFRGMIKSENIVCQYPIDQPYIEITVSATDAMVDLQQIEFKDTTIPLFPVPYEGKKSLLEILKLALSSRSVIHAGGSFYITLNTIEVNIMVYGQCTLEKIYMNCERFYSEDDRGFSYMNCYEVIESILKPFNCKMYAMGNTYFIMNYHEFWTMYRYRFNYDIATLTMTFSDLTGEIQDITSRYFIRYIEKQKIQPLKTVHVVFRNEDMGGDLTGKDMLSLDTYSHDFSSASIDANGYMVFNSSHLPGSNKHEDSIWFAEDFSTGGEGTHYIRIKMSYSVQSQVVTAVGTPIMDLEIRIKRPSTGGLWSTSVLYEPMYFGSADNSFISWIEIDTEAAYQLELYENGLHNIKFTFKPQLWEEWDWETLNIVIRSIEIVGIDIGQLPEYNPEIFSIDQDWRLENTTGIEKLDEEIIIGDGARVTEKGALRDATDDGLTHDWTRYSLAESLLLPDIYGRNILTNRSRYKNFLRLTIIDRDHAIEPRHLLQIQTAGGSSGAEDVFHYYAFSSYTKNYSLGEIEAELVEIVMENE